MEYIETLKMNFTIFILVKIIKNNINYFHKDG